MNVRESIVKAKLEIQLNLQKCCIELLELNSTGILRDGEVKRIVSIITDNTYNDKNDYEISEHDARSIVISTIHEQAMMVCAFRDVVQEI